MKAVALLMLVLANQGYWFGGRENSIAIQWALESDVPPAVLQWHVAIDQMTLPNGNGRVALPEGAKASTVRIRLPEVRVRTPMRWIYKVTSPDGAKVYATGEQALEVFPTNLLEGLAKRVDDKLVMVWDKSDGVPALLKTAAVPHRVIDRVDQFTMTRPDAVLVGAEQLADVPGLQAALKGLAAGGTSVMIYRQSRIDQLMGYPLQNRRVVAVPAARPPRADEAQPGTRLSYRFTHPLLQGMTVGDWLSFESAWTHELRSVELPADEAALEIIYWPREAPGSKPVPISALLLARKVGEGRFALCQLPLGPWESDPRSQMILANTIDYLLNRPEPTPRPSERPKPQLQRTTPVSTIPLR